MSRVLSKLESLIDLTIEGVNDPGILKCVFLAGGPGSGKSKVVADLFGITGLSSVSYTGLKLIASDQAFEKELHKIGINPKDLGTRDDFDYLTGDDPNSPRAKAKVTTGKLRQNYENGRLGLIVDGTGENPVKVQKLKDKADALGYDCAMVFVNTSLEVAQERNAKRSRTLPTELVESMWQNCQNNIGKFQSLFGNNFFIIDNSKSGSNITPSVQKAVKKFIDKPIESHIGKQWMNSFKK